MLDPTPPDGPSLVALRAFEAAARSGSFTRAAQELHVSAAAIAQHVKALEAWAQQPLFDRSARGVSLNDAGARARPALTDAFQRLAAATNQLREGNAHRRTIRIAALPAIAELWMTPRLDAVRRALPGLDVAVHAVDHAPDLERDAFDVTAYFETSRDDCDELVLVATPDRAGTLRDVGDLAQVPRLIDRAWEGHWHQWAGADSPLAAAPVFEFTLFSMAVDAAVLGHGVAVGPRSLLADHLARGELVEPFDRRVATGETITVRRRDDPALDALDGWVSTALARRTGR